MSSIQTSDGFRCPSVLLTYPTDNVEMDVTQLPALTRILESRVEDKNHLDKLQKEVESAAHENRKLQLTIISPNSTSETPTQALERTQSSSSSSSGVKL